ncbi:hypothetical protein [Spiroplasma turonicum]|uniref:Uncharacterized protein n=1 Tax=Spiroplasma turonicum TaxID=216946 RepID=A0A0K1P835_9MOLU|nr:hypothetical protein [Spiroplasma turonicum]AKU80037.1 hypothetical protein STURON_00791 [Spiroplasma turonicum]ALX71039.1 hypothetical protein STURO_v1c07880 [Spiroplasma turonicum]
MSEKIKVLKILKEGYDGIIEDEDYEDDERFWFEDDLDFSTTYDLNKTIDINEINEINKNNKISLIQNPNSNFFKPKDKTITFNKFDLQKPRYESFSIQDKYAFQKPSKIREEIITLRRAAYEQEQLDKDKLLNKINVKLKDNFKNYKLSQTNEPKSSKSNLSYYDKIASDQIIDKLKDFITEEIDKKYKKAENNVDETPNNKINVVGTSDKNKTNQSLKEIISEDIINNDSSLEKKESTELDMQEIKNNFSKIKTKIRSDFQNSRFKKYLHSKDYKNNKTAYQEYKKNNEQFYSENMTKEDQDFFNDLQKSFGKFYDKLNDDIEKEHIDNSGVNNDSEKQDNKNSFVNEELFESKMNDMLKQTDLSTSDNRTDSINKNNKQSDLQENINNSEITLNNNLNESKKNIVIDQKLSEESNVIEKMPKKNILKEDDSKILEELSSDFKKDKTKSLKNKEINKRVPITSDYDYTVSDTLDDFNKVLNNYSSKQELKEHVKEIFENKSSDTTQLLSKIVQKAKKLKNEDTNKDIVEFKDFESLLDDSKYIKNISKIAKQEKKKLKKLNKKGDSN